MSAKYQFHEAHDLHFHVHFVLSNNPYVSRRKLQCEFVDEDLVLRGTVKTYYQKQMAQESLRKINGVRRIINELVIADD